MEKPISTSWKAFTQTALPILEDGIKTGLWKIRYSAHQRYKFREDEGFESEIIAEPDLGGLVHDSKDELSATSQYKSLVQEMDADPQVARHIWKPFRTIQGGGTYSHWDFAILPILRQVRKPKKPFVFDDPIFKQSLLELDGFFYSDSAVLRYIAPLYNFDSEAKDEIRLSDDLKIRRTSGDELQQLMNMLSVYGQFPFFKVPKLNFSIELRVESPKTFGESAPRLTVEPNETLDQLVTALRVFKKGNVAIDIVRTTPEIKDIPGLHESTTHRESYLPTGHPYLLKKDEEASFESFWSNFSAVDPPKSDSVSIALRRFNFGYGRALPEDKLIDLVIALEALFLKRGERLNVHTLALRVARLLGNTFQERRSIFHEIQKIYGKRSGTVHGGLPSLTEDLVSSAEDRLRASFKSILQKLTSEQHDDILTHLDLD